MKALLPLLLAILSASCKKEMSNVVLTHTTENAAFAPVQGHYATATDGSIMIIKCDTTYLDTITAPAIPPPTDTLIPMLPTIFFGSSSTTESFWPGLLIDFELYNPMRKGNAGATYGHLLGYIKTQVTPFHPKQIVVQGGENDIYDAKSRGIKFNAADFNYRFKMFYDTLVKNNPQAKVTMVEIKKTPKLAPWYKLVDSCNTYIKNYIASKGNFSYVPINSVLLPGDYRSDGMHLKAEVYPRTYEPAIKAELIQ